VGQIIGKNPFEKAEEWSYTVRCTHCTTKNLVTIYDFSSYDGFTGLAVAKCAFCNEPMRVYIDNKAAAYIIQSYISALRPPIDFHLLTGRIFVIITYPLFTLILITLSQVMNFIGLSVFISLFTLWIVKSSNLYLRDSKRG
jgi:hypothetical protein